MARTPLYSPSPQRSAGASPTAPGWPPAAAANTPGGPGDADAGPIALDDRPAALARRVARALLRHERWLWGAALLLGLVIAGWPAWTGQAARPLAINQIDAALRESLIKEPLPAVGMAAYEAVLPSVVRVVGEPAIAAGAEPPGAASNAAKASKTPPAHPGGDEADPMDGRTVGTGVVIVDKGLILTNLHVVAGAARITVTFADGSQSEARVVSLQHDNDLAVLQALTIPDDLHAATLRSTAGLAPGDAVLAVGYPFGIGPSASQGVVSGLKREFRSPEGQRSLSNLIQFDAAANPGNSGGPLVTMDGHVVGIVTAIMNPNQQRTFIGIGFAVPIENAAAAVGMPPF